MERVLFLTTRTPQILAVAGSPSLSNDLPLLLEEIVFNGGQFPFNEHKVLAVEGSDAQAFLNNQITTDVHALEKGCFHLGAVLDIAARPVGFFHVLKVSEEKFFLLMHEEFYTPVFERLNKYLISEEVEFSEQELALFGSLGHKALKTLSEGFRGEYAGEPAIICFGESSLPLLDETKFALLKVATAYPVWKETIHELEIINNTSLMRYGLDRAKGCFLGQETVSKIESRRGAAFSPVLLRGEFHLNLTPGSPLVADGKRIGKFLAGEEGLALVSLNRENRIEGKRIQIAEPTVFSGRVSYFPVYESSQKAESFFYRGVGLFQEGDEESAERYLLMAIECDPVYEDAYESLGVLYGRQERFQEAVQYMEKLSEVNPKSVMAHTNMSLYYMKMGEIEKAEEEKSKATIKQFQQLGEEAEAKRKLEEAKKREKAELEKREGMFREVLDIDPDDVLANYGLGEIEYLKGNYELSVAHLETAVKAQKNYSVAWLALAKTYMAMETKDKALETLRQGIEIAGKNGDLMPANEMQRLLESLKDHK